MQETVTSSRQAILAGQHIKEEKYWLEKLSGLVDKSKFPYDYNDSRPGNKAREGSVHKTESQTFEFAGEIFSQLMKLSSGSDIRMHMILTTILVALLEKYTGRQDIVVGVPTLKQEIDADFVNTILILRNAVEDCMTFKDLLLQVRQTMVEAAQFQNYPVEVLPYRLGVSFTSDDDFPLFNIALLLENIHDKAYIRHLHLNMIFTFSRTGEKLQGKLEYNALRYDKATVRRILSHFRRISEEVLADVNIDIHSIEVLTDHEKHQLLVEFSGAVVDIPGNKTLPRLFRDQVEQTPDHIALVGVGITCDRSGAYDISMTYEALAEASEGLAGLLKQKGVGPGIIAAICAERSVEMAIGLLGILMAGGAYLPLEQGSPPQSKIYRLKDSRAQALLFTGEAGSDDIDSSVSNLICLENFSRYPYSGMEPNGALSSFDPAYIIYTSGTTGRPKGVVVEHRAAVNTLLCRKEEYRLTVRHSSLQLFSYAFDGFITSFFTPLFSGARVVLPGENGVKDIQQIKAAVVRHHVSHFICVPPLYQAIIENLSPGEASSLQVVTLAGDALSPGLLEIGKQKNPDLEIVNEYGITEVAVMSTIYRHQEKAARIVIGRPIWNTNIYIMDQRSRLQPVGVPGELCIGGAGLARGYLNNPELTAEKYNRSYKSYRTYILFKTGDLARWLPDPAAQGAYAIEFLGRKDHQVKIRGFRIEPGEIEHRLLELPQIKDAVVMAAENERGDKSLYAYLVLRRQPGDGDDAEINIPAIRAALLNHLPDHMVPTHFVKLEQMPLTATGKIDRRALTAMNVSAVSGIHFTEPGTPVEKKLADLWAGLLDKKQVGVEDNFFTIGGDSIKTITLLNLVNNEFKTKLKVIDLYENETIAKLAFKVELAVRETENAEDESLLKETADKIETLKNRIMEDHRLTGTEDIYPISDIQEGLIFYALRNTDEALYHIQFVYQIKQRDFDPVLFKKALSLLAQKHSMLRTTFDLVDYPEPVQLVHKEAVLDVEHYDISHMAPTEQEHFLKEVLRQDRARAFDIGRLPLWRMKSALLGNNNIALVSTLHHVIGDGWGSASLNTELRNTYDALKRDPGFTPGKLKSSYKDFIIRQEAEKERKKAAEFWKKELEDYKRADFLVTPKTGESPLDMSNHSCLLEEALLVNLKETALKINTSVKHLCFAAYNYIIGMLSYEKDFVVGLLTNNRPPIEDGEKIFGCFLNTVPARIHIPTGVRWLDYLEIVDKKLVEIKRYDSVSLFEIARLVGENPRDGNPFFDTLFNFVDFHIYDQLSRSSGVGDGSQEMEFPDPGFRVPGRQDTNTYFDFEISTTHGYFRLGCRYNRSAISEVLIGKIGVYFENILKEFISRPNALMSRDSVLPEEERRKIVIEFNDTSADFSREKTMHQLFEEQVSRSPEGVAVIDRDGVTPWTYEELNKRSNRLAWALQKKGLNVGGLAAVIMDRSAHMVTAVMAILKAGGAYVPFEPYLPDERIRKLMESLQIEIVITNEAQLPKVERISQTLPLLTHIICSQQSPGEEEEAKNLSPAAAAGDIAYVIFTSGSTGVPKGVVETHRPVINVIEWVNKTFAVGYPDKLLFVASLGFDLSVYDIFGILASGACLRVVDAEDIKNPQALMDIIMNEGITFWDSAPAALQQLATFFPEVGNYPVDSCLRLVFLSGDWIPVPLPDAVREAFPDARVISLGGATEATIWSNYYPIGEVDPSWVSIPYGKPIHNATYYILDPHMELCPIGTPGDLYIGGQCLASEYKNDPGLTAAKFIANPFVPGEKLYKTGDLARWFEDGNMEFLGRKDLQVKIRGYRIELGEIESRLLEHEEIHEAVVLVKGSSRDDKYLAAYFTADREFEPGELKTFLLKELPDYMTPRCFVQLQKMPVSANGKLDRKALPEPEVSSESGTVYTAPENKTQEKLADIWSQVLGVDKELIGINADFFRLGGHSLNATMVISRVHKEFNVKVPLAEIFNSPTIRELSLKIKASESELYAGVEPVEKKEYYRLSSAQKRLYFLQQMEPGNTGYNIQEGVLLEGDVNLSLLGETFRQLIQLHESLRTSFETVNEETVQRVHEHVEFTIELLGRGDPTWSSFIRPFDLSKAPLLRVGLFEPEDKKFVLLVDMHHIVSDGVSQAVLKRDFGIIYSGGQLPAIRLQYKDYSEWQYSERQQQLVGTQKAYWLNELSGDIPVLDIPTDYPRPMIQSYEGNTLAFDLDQEETELLNKLGRGEKATLYMVLVALYNVLLFKLSNQEEIIIGTPTAGRRHSELERIIGMFVNTLALKNYPQTGKSFTSFLQEVKENTLKAFENQDYPFEELVDQVDVKRDTARNPLFDVLFVLQNVAVEAVETSGANGSGAGAGDSRLKIHPYHYIAAIAKFDVTLMAVEAGKGIHFSFEYCTRLFKEETIRYMIEYFKRIVSEVTGTPGKRLSEIDILSEEEKNLLLYDFNDTEAEYPRDKTIHGLFEEQVKRTPDRVGLVGDVRHVGQVGLTYQKLNERSGQLAQLLIEKGVLADHIVGVMVERSIEMIIGIFGILKAGGAYLPIDPKYPEERINFMLADSNAKILLGMEDFQKKIIVNCQLLMVNYELVMGISHIPQAPFHHSSHLCYIIYTSGSTGNPKGVMIEHRSVVNRLHWMQKCYPIGPGDVIMQKTPTVFDVSVWELFWWSMEGASLCLLGVGEEKIPEAIIGAIARNRVTTMHFVPSMLQAFLEYCEDAAEITWLSSLRQVFSSGEALVGNQVEKFNRLLNEKNKTKLINLYGPTEATVDVSYYNCIPGENIINTPIGKPIDNIALYVLDKALNPQPVGITGELCISGVGLARGYLNQPGLTAEKFKKYRSNRSNRPYILYKTGDLARRLPDGNIEFLGRIDHQVKIRGFRIELGEIENQLLCHDGIKGAAVLEKDQHLYAYIAVKGEDEFNESMLRNYLSKQLPGYMIPSYFVQIEEIPLTANGKVDRKKLPLPRGSVNLEGTYTAPRLKEEALLAEIWQEVLELERVGIDDNFFKVGGDSIKTIRLTGAINRRLNSHLKILDLYTHGTIRQLATLLDRQEAFDRQYLYDRATAEVEALKVRLLKQKPELADMIEDIYPMSDIEKGMVFYYLKNVGTGIYHDQFVYPIYYKNFDVKLFSRAINLMMEKHPALRTTYNLEDFEESVSIVYKRVTPDFTYRDLSQLSRDEQYRRITGFLDQDRKTPFVEVAAPLTLWRVGIFELGEGNLYFTLIVHHAVLDGWSVASLVTEVHNTYLELKDNPSYVPGELKSTYKDALIEELIVKQGPLSREYWKQELEEYPRLEFSETLKSKSEMEAMTTHLHNTEPGLLEQLNRLADRCHTNIKNLCFGAYACFMNMFSYEDDVVVGVVTNTRTEKEDGDKVLGCFLNTVPVRLKIPRGITWKEYIELVERKMLEVKKHERLSLFEIAAAIGEKNKDRNPIFDTLFNFMDFHIFRQVKPLNQEQEEKEGRGKNRVFVGNSQDTNTLFDFEVNITRGTVILCPKYNRSAISDETVKRCCGYFLNILYKFIEDPDGIVRNDAILSGQEKEQVLYQFNDTAAPYASEKTMHQLFEEQVSRSAESVAIIDRDGVMQWTYEELNKRSNRLARALRKKGLKPGGLAAVIMDRSIQMVSAVMGILKAGGAYVPLEPYLPDERIRKLLESLHIETVIVNEAQLLKVNRISQTLPGLTHLVCPDKIPAQEIELLKGKELLGPVELEQEGVKNPVPAAKAGDISYIIFTSGSTGTPKGVVETHRPVINVIEWVNKTFGVGYPDKLLFVASLGFDLSVYDIFGILASGGCLRVAAAEDIKDPGMLLDIIMNEGITFWDSAPAALQQLVPFLPEVTGYAKPGRLRLVFLSGDWIPVSMPDALREAFEGVQVISLGGATEATVWSNYYPIGEVDPSWASIPYGKPIQNAKYYILDRNLEVCPLRVPGDLYIGGECLAVEYINDASLSAHKFIANPFLPGETIYRTGDIARWFEDGNMQFLGRKDQQVKIRGYRIELGEIESQLTSHPRVSDGIVLDRVDGTGNKYLCAYYVSKVKGEEIDREELKEYLSRELPEYMIPAHFMAIEKIPLTANGKLDRKGLPEPGASSESGAAYAAPENETQEKLVEIWSQILGDDKKTIGINEDFFQLGGHSLNATMVISRIHKEFNVKVPLAEIFNSPTIRELSRKIKVSEREVYAAIEPVEKKEYYRLSSAQRRLYFLQQMEPDNTAYNIQEEVMLEGVVDIPLLEETFRKLIRRHESLRTSFEIVNQETVQRIHDNVTFEIDYYDLSTVYTDYTDHNDDKIHHSSFLDMPNHFIRAFDLSKAPLLRVGVFRLEEMKHLLLTDMHHIISDGVSHAVLRGDFRILYGGGQLPVIRLQYKDYSEWQNSEKKQESLKQQEEYWLSIFKDDIPVLKLPTDFPRPALFNFEEGDIYFFSIDKELTALFNQALFETGTTMYMFLLAVFNVLLAKYSRQEDIVVGTPVAGRRHSDLENIIGMFVNMLTMRNHPKANKTFSNFLYEVKENALKAYENQDYQFEELVSKLDLSGVTDRNPLFSVVFADTNLQTPISGKLRSTDTDKPELVIKPGEFSKITTKFDLRLAAFYKDGEIKMSLTYSSVLFKPITVEKMAERFLETLQQVIENPGIELKDIMISHDMVVTTSDTLQDYREDFNF